MDDFAKTPFLSARNVPLWVGVVMAAIIAGVIFWLHPAHG